MIAPPAAADESIHSVSLVVTLKGVWPTSATEVAFTRGFDLADPKIAAPNSLTSVLHPRSCREFSVPQIGSTFKIAFLAPRCPLRLLSSPDKTFQRIALFGCGLCSVVLVSEDGDWLRAFVHETEPELYDWEIWDIREGQLYERTHDALPEPKLDPEVVLPVAGVQDDSTIWMIQELSLNLNRFVFNARRFAPYLLEELRTLSDEVVELIDEIKDDETALFLNPSQAEADSENTSNEMLLRRKKRLNTNIDLLVQLNSALVYAVSQAFHAAAPNYQRGGHISQHALLGTGSAWRAIHRLCSSVFDTFRSSHFPERLRDSLEFDAKPNTKAVKGGVALTEIDRAEELSEIRLNTRIVHFSARRGFGESDGAITCPSQALQVCSEPEWSLCTITHEILHAHVRELIAAVLTEEAAAEIPTTQEEALAGAIDEFERFQIAKKRGNPELSRLNEVRFGLIEFALSYRNAIDKAKEKYRLTQPEFETEEILITLPKEIEATFRAFKKAFRLLEETIVHILDLHYFHCADTALFCDSIWYSWSIVPSVVEKLDWYILRTLLALASRTSGDPYDRLAATAQVLSDSLNRVLRQKKGAVIASEVLRRIDPLRPELTERKDSPFFKWIDLLFPACLPLVDLTTTFFLSRSLIDEFSRQDEGVVDDSRRYILEPVDFSIKHIERPVAFVYDRLRTGLEGEGVRPIAHDEIARRSAWLLVALSSEPTEMSPT